MTRWPADGSRLGDAGGEGSHALSAGLAGVRRQWKENSGAPLPGTPNVGSRVLAKPLRFELWGAREDLLLADHALSRFAISRLARRTRNTRTQDLYWFGPPLWCNTLLHCVVVDCLLG